ncbi:MAG: DUF364 domain-containing protein [Desulfobacteraceae bacterium]|nr:DUF364 domain-containing protein [Desulfobacteraceae bacterium]
MTRLPCPEPITHVMDRPLKEAEKELVNKMILAINRPEIFVEKVVVGSKFLAVIAGNRMGLSSLLNAVPGKDEIKLVEKLVGKPIGEAVKLIRQPSPFLISLGVAALNAGNAPDPAGVESANFPADKLIARLGKDKITGLVGEFPFVKQLAPRVGTLHLFELKSVSHALPRDQWEIVLPKLDVLALTGTALLTRQMAWYLSRASQAKIVILGPTTPTSRVLFEHGANYLCGSVVTDMEKVAASIKADFCFRDIKKNGGILFTQWEK